MVTMLGTWTIELLVMISDVAPTASASDVADGAATTVVNVLNKLKEDVDVDSWPLTVIVTTEAVGRAETTVLVA